MPCPRLNVPPEMLIFPSAGRYTPPVKLPLLMLMFTSVCFPFVCITELFASEVLTKVTPSTTRFEPPLTKTIGSSLSPVFSIVPSPISSTVEGASPLTPTETSLPSAERVTPEGTSIAICCPGFTDTVSEALNEASLVREITAPSSALAIAEIKLSVEDTSTPLKSFLMW